MLEFVIQNNYSEFDVKVKQQLSDAAIGTKCIPPYACIFKDKAKTDFVESQKHKPMAWNRYIDDIYLIWTHGKDKLEQFVKELNKTHSNLKFMNESSEEKISFLNLSVCLCNGKPFTDLHNKATDCHQYLEYTSPHPDHTKKSTVYSQELRLSRLCSFEEDIVSKKSNMRSSFLKRRYPEEIVDKEMSKVKFNRSVNITRLMMKNHISRT